MTDKQRDDLRSLQDRWLALPVVQAQVRNHGESGRITGQKTSPTFADVRTLLLPEWREWFQDFFM